MGSWADGHIARLQRGAIQGERYQIGNNRGGINGWIPRRQISGRPLALAP